MGEVTDMSVGEIAPAGFGAALDEAARFLTRPAPPTGARPDGFTLAPDGALTCRTLVHPMRASQAPLG